MKGLVYYTSSHEDPHIKQTIDSDEEEEREDFELKDSDNLVAVAKMVKVIFICRQRRRSHPTKTTSFFSNLKSPKN